jgi:hypothetical protein
MYVTSICLAPALVFRETGSEMYISRSWIANGQETEGNPALSLYGREQGKIERRASPRARVLKHGKLIFANRKSVFDCVVRDISEGGARIACAHAGILPTELQLMLCSSRDVRDVRVVWRRPDQVGVQFLSPPRKAGHLHV